jgi:cardiolipin synthase
LQLAREANVFVRDRGFAQSLQTSLERAILVDSEPVHQQRWSTRPLVDRVLTWLLYGVARSLMSVLGYGRN